MKHFLTNFFIALAITATPLIILLAPLVLNYNKSGNNTFVVDKDYSHLSRSEIINRLNQDFIIPQKINLQFDTQVFYLNTASISASINTDKTAGSLLYRRLDEGIFKYIK